MFTDQERKQAHKIRLIQACLNRSPVDIEGLKRCSMTEFGFVNSALRKKIWPMLLDIDPDNIINHTNAIIEHRETDQVAKDVERSMWRFTKGKSKLRNQKRAELTRIINAILSLHPQLHYFQGYHEIGSILLLVTDESLSFAMLERLSLNHINDNMLPSFSEVSKILNLLFPLLSFVDPQTYEFITDSQVQPMFTISWILTWFAHNFDELENIARLYDYFLSSHPLSPLYFSVILINHFKPNLLSLECAYDVVHSFFSTLPEDLPLDKLIKQTQQLMEKIPPKKLQEKSKIFLLKESPMCTYPYPWMKAMTLKSKMGSGEKKPFNIFKLSFFILFGSFCVLGLSVFISLYQAHYGNGSTPSSILYTLLFGGSYNDNSSGSGSSILSSGGKIISSSLNTIQYNVTNSFRMMKSYLGY